MLVPGKILLLVQVSFDLCTPLMPVSLFPICVAALPPILYYFHFHFLLRFLLLLMKVFMVFRNEKIKSQNEKSIFSNSKNAYEKIITFAARNNAAIAIPF